MISSFVAKSIRGCHPTFSSIPCNDDWHLLSILDYYRLQTEMKHPHPGKYWRYAYEAKWGWNHSITDFKTQSIKEYILLCKIIQQKKGEILFILLCIQRMFSIYDRASFIPSLIKEFLFHDLSHFKDYMLCIIQKTYEPIQLPYIHPINPLEVFIGRCKQYDIIHANTQSCITEHQYEISFHDLFCYCKVLPRPHIKHPYIYVYNRESFYLLIRAIYRKDLIFYNDPMETELFKSCHYNMTGQPNKYFYAMETIISKELHLEQPSVIDAWCEDLFGW